MAQETITLKCPPASASGVRDALTDAGFEFSDAPYAFFRARGQNCVITFYNKGKLVIQGADPGHWADLLAPGAERSVSGGSKGKTSAGGADRFDEALGLHPTPAPPVWIGIDETGKGDYFGPLVVVAAAVERKHVGTLIELGVADSKKLADKKAIDLAKQLKQFVTWSQLVLKPEAYNSLYARIGNLNRLLAWGHARCLEDCLGRVPDVGYAISDQFARDPGVVKRALMERGRAIRLDQRTKAESDPAVAAASIIARAEFLWQMRAMSKEAGRELPKGAGPPVLAAARSLVVRDGIESMGRWAKLHFVTTKQIV